MIQSNRELEHGYDIQAECRNGKVYVSVYDDDGQHISHAFGLVRNGPDEKVAVMQALSFAAGKAYDRIKPKTDPVKNEEELF